MRNLLRIACLTGAGVLVIGALLRADVGSVPQPKEDAAALTPQVQPAAAPVLIAQQSPKPPTVATTPAAAHDAVPDAGWIGLMLDEAQPASLRVANVFPGGPAAFGGVRVGDILEKIGDTKVASAAAASEAIERLAPSKPATLTIRRGEKVLECTVNVGSRKEFQEHYAREMWRRDPRDPNFGKHHGVSEADMHVEVIRRLFEQNQRLESKLNLVLDEVQTLRAEVRDSRRTK